MEVSIKIHEHNSPIPIMVGIRDGKYKSCYYSSLLLAENNVILQGEETIIVHADAKFITLSIKSTKMAIAEIVGDNEIFITGSHAIPEGSEKEILEKLLDS